MAGLMLLAFMLGILFAIGASIALLYILNRFKLIRNIQRDVDVDRRLTECEAAINAIAVKIGDGAEHDRPQVPAGKDPELYEAGSEAIGRDA